MFRHAPLRLRLGFGVPALLSLAACTATPAPLFLSPQAVVLETPVVRQDKLYECGLVAVSALCSFHGVEISPAQSEELAVLAAEKQGLSGGELEDTLKQLGFEVFLFEGALGDGPMGLAHHLDAGRPLLVMTNEDGSNYYSLVIGHDPGTQSVILLSPRRGRVVLPASTFDRIWEAARRFTLLAVPRSAK